ncbi:unnamed protein product [Gordionus sp. m RMFG-2023]
MYIDQSYIEYSKGITYGIVVASLIGLGLIGNFIYFWCLFKNQRIVNPKLSSEPITSNKFVHLIKLLNPINAKKDVIHRKKSSLSRSKSNIYLYIKTLVISDFLFCINSIIVPVTYMACYITCRKSYLFSLYSLKIGFPLMDIFTHFSYILRVFISLDRLWALEFPFTYRTKMSNSFLKYLIILGFIVTCSVTIPYSWGFIVVKEIKLKPIPNNQFTNNTLAECKNFKLIDGDKYKGGKNDSDSHLDHKYIIEYNHSPNPKARWFLTYREWITFIMSFIPFTVTTIANFFVIRRCYKISNNGINLKGNNNNVNNNISVVHNKTLSILTKRCNKILGIHSRTNRNRGELKIVTMRGALTAMKKREYQITILMSATNVHFAFTTIPMTVYIFMYYKQMDRFSTKAELWFQNISFLSKYGNNALSVYITLFFDPTMKVIFFEILRKLCCYSK